MHLYSIQVGTHFYCIYCLYYPQQHNTIKCPYNLFTTIPCKVLNSRIQHLAGPKRCTRNPQCCRCHELFSFGFAGCVMLQFCHISCFSSMDIAHTMQYLYSCTTIPTCAIFKFRKFSLTTGFLLKRMLNFLFTMVGVLLDCF